jgi:hypothetical protein
MPAGWQRATGQFSAGEGQYTTRSRPSGRSERLRRRVVVALDPTFHAAGPPENREMAASGNIEGGLLRPQNMPQARPAGNGTPRGTRDFPNRRRLTRPWLPLAPAKGRQFGLGGNALNVSNRGLDSAGSIQAPERNEGAGRRGYDSPAGSEGRECVPPGDPQPLPMPISNRRQTS